MKIVVALDELNSVAPEVKQTMLSPNERINAITWKCAQMGITYGRFVNRYSESDMQNVYREYELLLFERRQKEKKWVAHSGKRESEEDGSNVDAKIVPEEF